MWCEKCHTEEEGKNNDSKRLQGKTAWVRPLTAPNCLCSLTHVYKHGKSIIKGDRAHGPRRGRPAPALPPALSAARARVSGVQPRAALRPEAPHCFLGGGGRVAAGAARERPPRFLGAPAPPRGRGPAALSPCPRWGAGVGRRAAGVPEPPSSPATSLGPAFGSMPGATSSEGRGLLQDPAEHRGGRR